MTVPERPDLTADARVDVLPIPSLQAIHGAYHVVLPPTATEWDESLRAWEIDLAGLEPGRGGIYVAGRRSLLLDGVKLHAGGVHRVLLAIQSVDSVTLRDCVFDGDAPPGAPIPYPTVRVQSVAMLRVERCSGDAHLVYAGKPLGAISAFDGVVPVPAS